MTASMFPEFDPPVPAPVPTTAPLFELSADAAKPAAADHGPRPEAPHRAAPDVALFDTRFTLPAEDAEELAFGFTV